MKASDLRHGNWVHHKKDEWSYRNETGVREFDFQWEDDDFWAINESMMDYDYIEPIPLTEEWLKKFGFQKNEYDNYVRNILTDRFRINKESLLIAVPRENVMSDPNKNPPFEHGFGVSLQSYILDDVALGVHQYVHTFQNLYHALTGEELEIRL